METRENTFDKSQYHWLVFKTYKFFKKFIKYSLYILMFYLIYSGVEWMFEG